MPVRRPPRRATHRTCHRPAQGRWLTLAAPALAACFSAPLAAQGVTVTPSLTVSQSVTDNQNLSATDKEWQAVTTITPGVRVASRGGRVQGSLDYSLSANLQARGGGGDSLTQNLAGTLRAEVIERHADVSANARISQQSISAFGVQDPDFAGSNRNRTEVRTVSVSPRAYATLGGSVSAQAGATWTQSDTGARAAADSSSLSTSLGISGLLGRVGWSFDATQTTSDFQGGRETTTRFVGVGVNARPHYDWAVNARAGRETESVRELFSQTTSSWGVGATWTPSARTTLSTTYDRRYFGNAWSIALSHRMARTFWQFSDSRNASDTGANNRGLNFANAYDNLFQQLAPAFPNPVERDAIVRLLLAELGGFTARAVSLQRQQQASVSLRSYRTSLTLNAFRTDTRRLDNTNTFSDEVLLAGRIVQHGYTLGATYTVSPRSNLSLSYRVTTTPTSGTFSGTELRTFSAGFSTSLARRISLNVSLRHTAFDSATNPYTENGGVATVSMSF